MRLRHTAVEAGNRHRRLLKLYQQRCRHTANFGGQRDHAEQTATVVFAVALFVRELAVH